MGSGSISAAAVSVALFVGASGLLLGVSDLRDDLEVHGKVQLVIHEAASALVFGRPRDAHAATRRLRTLLADLDPSASREGALRAAATAIAALASREDASASSALNAVQRLGGHMQTESSVARSRLLRLSVAACVLAAAGGLCLLLFVVRRREPEKPVAVAAEDGALERLSRLVDEAELTAERVERFLSALDAVWVDVDGRGRVQRVSAGASELFGRPRSQMLESPIVELIKLRTEDGEVVEDLGQLGAMPHVLEDAQGSSRSVILDYVDLDRDGACLLFRRVKPGHERLPALRELHQARVSAFSDPTLILVLVGSDDRLRGASVAAHRRLGIPDGMPSLQESWGERSGLLCAVEQVRRSGDFQDRRDLVDVAQRAFSTDLRVTGFMDGGAWVRAVPLPFPPEAGLEVEPDEASVSPPLAAPEASSARVLVIDDEPAIGRSLVRALRGVDVQVAPGGAVGLTLALEQADRWDLVLCDIGMPEVDGVKVHSEIARSRPDLLERLVFMTGALHTERARRFVDEVKPRLISKPFELEEVRAELAQRRRRTTATGG